MTARQKAAQKRRQAQMAKRRAEKQAAKRAKRAAERAKMSTAAKAKAQAAVVAERQRKAALKAPVAKPRLTPAQAEESRQIISEIGTGVHKGRDYVLAPSQVDTALTVAKAKEKAELAKRAKSRPQRVEARKAADRKLVAKAKANDMTLNGMPVVEKNGKVSYDLDAIGKNLNLSPADIQAAKKAATLPGSQSTSQVLADMQAGKAKGSFQQSKSAKLGALGKTLNPGQTILNNIAQMDPSVKARFDTEDAIANLSKAGYMHNVKSVDQSSKLQEGQGPSGIGRYAGVAMPAAIGGLISMVNPVAGALAKTAMSKATSKGEMGWGDVGKSLAMNLGTAAVGSALGGAHQAIKAGGGYTGGGLTGANITGGLKAGLGKMAALPSASTGMGQTALQVGASPGDYGTLIPASQSDIAMAAPVYPKALPKAAAKAAPELTTGTAMGVGRRVGQTVEPAALQGMGSGEKDFMKHMMGQGMGLEELTGSPTPIKAPFETAAAVDGVEKATGIASSGLPSAIDKAMSSMAADQAAFAAMMGKGPQKAAFESAKPVKGSQMMTKDVLASDMGGELLTPQGSPMAIPTPTPMESAIPLRDQLAGQTSSGGLLTPAGTTMAPTISPIMGIKDQLASDMQGEILTPKGTGFASIEPIPAISTRDQLAGQTSKQAAEGSEVLTPKGTGFAPTPFSPVMSITDQLAGQTSSGDLITPEGSGFADARVPVMSIRDQLAGQTSDGKLLTPEGTGFADARKPVMGIKDQLASDMNGELLTPEGTGFAPGGTPTTSEAKITTPGADGYFTAELPQIAGLLSSIGLPILEKWLSEQKKKTGGGGGDSTTGLTGLTDMFASAGQEDPYSELQQASI